MFRTGLIALAGYYGLTALYLWFLPNHFYENTPSVIATGGFNMHFIRDIALAFGTASGLIVWGLRRRIPELCLAGSIWVALHGLFHINIQIARGLPMDIVLLSDTLGVILPAALAVWFSWKNMEIA